MTIYSYKIGSNQYQKRVKTPKFGPILALGAGVTLLASVILPIGPDKNTQFLKQFSFGEFPKVAMAFEPNIAGTSAILKKPETKEEIIAASNHPEEIFHIWEKETSKGKNTNPNALHNVCKAKGQTNEFGFGGMQHMWCFDSFQEAVTTIDEWLTKRDKESLCYYNQGVRTTDCNYVK